MSASWTTDEELCALRDGGVLARGHEHCETYVCIEVDASDPAQLDCPKRVQDDLAR